MRRYLDQQPQNQKLFRGGELMRLMMMIVMMGVVWSLISTARNPAMWKFLAREIENDNYTIAELRKREAELRGPQLAGVGLVEEQAVGAASDEKAPEAVATEKKADTEPAAENPATDTPATPAEPAKANADQPQAANADAEKPAAEQPAAEKPATATPATPDEPVKADSDKLQAENAEAAKPDAAKPEATKPETATSEPAAASSDKPEPAKPDAEQPTKPAAENAPAPAAKPAAQPNLEAVESGKQAPTRKFDAQPLDLDPQQQERLATEFAAIQDKRPLSAEEMPAYWRLMRWQYGQSTDMLRDRARKDVYFTHMWQKPDKFRGQLIRARVHIKRIMTDTCEENIPGVTRMYDAWVTTDDAPNQPTVIAFCDLPSPNMKLGPKVEEEAVFYGYFFKLLGYTAKDDKYRAAPMLIGRLVWYPKAPPPAKSDWTWPLVFAGIAVVVVGARIIFMFVKPKPRESLLNRGVRLNDAGEEAIPVEDWLDQAEQPEEPHAEEQPTNGHRYLDGRRSGGITHPRFSTDYDHKEDELN